MSPDSWQPLQWGPHTAGHILQTFMFGAGPAGTNTEDIRDQVHALNKLVQR